MTGRYKKVYEPLWRSIEAQNENGVRFCLGKIQVLCPVCGSPLIGGYGTHKRKIKRVEMFQCKNPECTHLNTFKTPKQFVLITSHKFQELIGIKLKEFYEDLMLEGAKQKTLAKKYAISEAQVSALRTEIETAIHRISGLDSLVLTPQPDTAIAIDETFLKIEGTSIYIIIATGYTSRKVLGIKVSKSRFEEDIREVFNEADRNTEHDISIVSSDALNSTQSMTKNLGREITHVIHPHKKPYKKAIIKHYQHEGNERVTGIVGIESDFFKKRGKRQFKYMETREDLTPKPKGKRGRPLGSKTKKKKNPIKPNKKRGRKGLFTVFSKGTIGYASIDPYRDKLKISKELSSTVASALDATLILYALMSIQNNLAENLNAFLRAVLRLTGPKTIESVEQRIRATFKVRNHPELIEEIWLERRIRAEFLYNNLKLMEYAELLERGILI